MLAFCTILFKGKVIARNSDFAKGSVIVVGSMFLKYRFLKVYKY